MIEQSVEYKHSSNNTLGLLDGSPTAIITMITV